MPLLTAIQKMDAARAAGLKVQERANTSLSGIGDFIELKALRLMLITAAESRLSEFPQYEGHFDHYDLVRIDREIKTKGGTHFLRGDLAIAKKEWSFLERRSKWVAFSVRVWCDVALGPLSNPKVLFDGPPVLEG